MVQKYPISRFTSTSKPTTRRSWSRSTPTSSRTSTKSGATSTRSKTCTARFFRRFEPTTRSRPNVVWKTWSKKTSDSVDEFKRRWKLKSQKSMRDSNNSRKRGKALKTYLSKSESFTRIVLKYVARGNSGAWGFIGDPNYWVKSLELALTSSLHYLEKDLVAQWGWDAQ